MRIGSALEELAAFRDWVRTRMGDFVKVLSYDERCKELMSDIVKYRIKAKERIDIYRFINTDAFEWWKKGRKLRGPNGGGPKGPTRHHKYPFRCKVIEKVMKDSNGFYTSKRQCPIIIRGPGEGNWMHMVCVAHYRRYRKTGSFQGLYKMKDGRYTRRDRSQK